MEEERFKDEVSIDETDVDDEIREQAERDFRLLRALGLAEGELDLIEATSRLGEETILAYYDPDDERIVVRGTDLDVSTRVTLVHELVHVLQDQHFDLEQLDEIEDSGAALAADSLVEGDATVVEDAYVESLSRADQRAYEQDFGEFEEDVDLEGVPEALALYQAVPYVLGPALVDALLADGGHERLDAAFSDLPTTEEHVLAPLTFLDDEETFAVDAPALDADEVEDSRDSFGAFGLFLVLSERIDAHDALAAADGWGGDAYVTYHTEGGDPRDCVRATFVGQDDPGTTRLEGTLREWASAGPAGTASVTATDARVELTACDPGQDATVVTGTSGEAFALPVARSAFLRAFLSDDAPLDEAWCAAARLAEETTLDELNDETGESFAAPDFQARLFDAISGCLVG
jgi:hypothetical protein